MANIPNTPDDRRDVPDEGRSPNRSTKGSNDATAKAVPPQGQGAEGPHRDQHTGMSESGVIARSPEPEIVDQDPGEAQKRNQGEEKDDPLAA